MYRRGPLYSSVLSLWLELLLIGNLSYTPCSEPRPTYSPSPRCNVHNRSPPPVYLKLTPMCRSILIPLCSRQSRGKASQFMTTGGGGLPFCKDIYSLEYSRLSKKRRVLKYLLYLLISFGEEAFYFVIYFTSIRQIFIFTSSFKFTGNFLCGVSPVCGGWWWWWRAGGTRGSG